MADLNVSTLERFIDEKNFIAAYLLVKDATVTRPEMFEYTGRIVSAIISEMGAGGSRSDKSIYYRSLLLYIFEEIPGLGRIYSRQLRIMEESKSSFDLLSNLRSLVDASKDKEELKAKIEETFEGIKDTIEDTTQDIKDGTAQKKMDDFLYIAGEGIKEGLKQFSSFMRNVSESAREQQKDDETIRTKAEPVEDKENDQTSDKSGESKSE
jgi:hypothetical protein